MAVIGVSLSVGYYFYISANLKKKSEEATKYCKNWASNESGTSRQISDYSTKKYTFLFDMCLNEQGVK